MIPRRVFLGAAALLPLATRNVFAQAPTVTPVHVQDLPDVRLDGWTATVVEVGVSTGRRLAAAPSPRLRARLRARRRDPLWSGWRRADHLSRQPGVLRGARRAPLRVGQRQSRESRALSRYRRR